jgi:hypothetical protein
MIASAQSQVKQLDRGRQTQYNCTRAYALYAMRCHQALSWRDGASMSGEKWNP